ncbi:MAG: fatty acid desaturase [Acidimicrobiales bacterium]
MPGIVVAVIIGLALCQLGLYLTTVYLHRTLSHRAIKMSAPLSFVCRALVWLLTGITPRQWVAVHRKHHAFTDVAGDPHSPILEGFAVVELTNAWLYHKVAKDPAAVTRYARDLPPDRWDRVVFDHGIVGLVVGWSLTALGLGWELALVVWAVHIVTYLLLNGAINAVGHSYGRRLFSGQATNSQWLAWMVAGEGLHSNHHAAPTSARLALHPGEVDPAWWFISMARRLRWLSVRHSEVHLSPRARVSEAELV